MRTIKYSNYLKISVLITMLLLIIMMITVFLVDPIMYFRKNDKIEYPLNHGPSYFYNPGITKNIEFDSVIVGSSMTQNILTSEVDELFHTKSIKLGQSGAYPRDVYNNLKNAFSENDLKVVLLSIDTFGYKEEFSQMRHDKTPMYLYDNNPVNDVKYLLNKDILFDYIPYLTLYNNLGKKTTSMDEYQSFNKLYTYSKAKILETYKNTSKKKTPSLNLDNCIYNAKLNLENNIIPFIEENPETQFYLYFPPHSILNWNVLVLRNEFDLEIGMMKLITSKLLDYKNVHIYFYPNKTDIIENLDNYKDLTHYSTKVDDFIIKDMSSEESLHLLNKDDWEIKIDDFQSYIESYDFDPLINKQ